MRKTLPLCALLCFALSACNTLTVTTPPAACAKLVPEAWREGVEGTPVPDAEPVTVDPCATLPAVAQGYCRSAAQALADVKLWAGAYVGASADTEKANGRTRDAIDIFTNCEAMVNAARKGR